MKIMYKKPSDLKQQKYNPKIRTTEKNLKQLKSSIEQHGILVPLLTDENNNLIDGHRRLKISKQLKMKLIPVIQTKTAITSDEAFEMINTTQRKISNNDLIYIYCNGGRVPEKAFTAIQKIESIIGRKELIRIGNEYVTYRIINYAELIARYCKVKAEDTVFLKKAILWLVDKKMIFLVRRAMEHKTSRIAIVQCIKRNRPLKMHYN